MKNIDLVMPKSLSLDRQTDRQTDRRFIFRTFNNNRKRGDGYLISGHLGDIYA